MITTPWERIDAAVLQALCDAGDAGDAGEAESSTLDFKQAAPLTQGQDRCNEFAKDISAFANANGGNLVYGIEEIDAHACRLVPIPGETFDALTRRLNQVLANPVEPRVAGVRFKEVALAGGGFALVVRVPRSFDGPHRYTVTPEHQRFMTRTDTGAIDMDYTQLRDAFGRTATLIEKARAFRTGPALVGLTGIECGRHPFLTPNTGGVPYGNGIADQEHLVLPEHVVESLASDVDVDTIARPLLDAFWQCFGEVRCELYDTAGEWAPVG